MQNWKYLKIAKLEIYNEMGHKILGVGANIHFSTFVQEKSGIGDNRLRKNQLFAFLPLAGYRAALNKASCP